MSLLPIEGTMWPSVSFLVSMGDEQKRFWHILLFVEYNPSPCCHFKPGEDKDTKSVQRKKQKRKGLYKESGTLTGASQPVSMVYAHRSCTYDNICLVISCPRWQDCPFLWIYAEWDCLCYLWFFTNLNYCCFNLVIFYHHLESDPAFFVHPKLLLKWMGVFGCAGVSEALHVFYAKHLKYFSS